MALSFIFSDELSEPEEDPLALDVDVDIDIDVNSVTSAANIVTVTDTDAETAKLSSSSTTTLEKNSRPNISIISTKSFNKNILNSKPRKWICQVCSNIFPNKTNLMNHEAQRRSDAPIKCSFEPCPVLMCTSFDIKSHHRRCHESQIMTCSHCSKSFPNHSQFVKHSPICRARQKWRNKGFKFQCVPCGSFYRYELGLQLHEQEYHSKGCQVNYVGEKIELEHQLDQIPVQNIDIIPSTGCNLLEKCSPPADFDEEKKRQPGAPLVLLTDDPTKPTDPVETTTKVKTESTLEVDNNTLTDQVKLELVGDINQPSCIGST